MNKKNIISNLIKMTSSKSFVRYFVNSFAIRISVVLALLFFILTPGVILSIPPSTTSSTTTQCNWITIPFLSQPTDGCQPNNIVLQALVHSIVFGVLTFLIISQVFKRR
jgi:hypothetical protein